MLKIKIRILKRLPSGELKEIEFDASAMGEILDAGEIFLIEYTINNLIPSIRIHIDVTEETTSHSDS